MKDLEFLLEFVDNGVDSKAWYHASVWLAAPKSNNPKVFEYLSWILYESVKEVCPMKVMLSLLFTFTVVSIAYSAPMAVQPSDRQQSVPMSKAVEPPASGANLGSVTGTVLETMDAAGYTYMRLKTPKGEIWAAVQKAT